MHISRWGNSLALRLPVAVVQALKLREGDDIEVLIAGERTFQIKKKPGRSEFLSRLRKFRNALPADFSFDREAANGRR
jgi:antitoxin MazE